jgi:hypothetical protein
MIPNNVLLSFCMKDISVVLLKNNRLLKSSKSDGIGFMAIPFAGSLGTFIFEVYYWF